MDWISEGADSPDFVKSKREELNCVADVAEGVFAVSEPLSEKPREDCGIETVSMPTGADLRRLRDVPPAETAALRHSFGLDEQFIIGYIGNHGDYTGVEFRCRHLPACPRMNPQRGLADRGPAECWRSPLETARADGVIWAGAVPPAEVRKYFKVLDVGILAQEKSLGTER